LIATSHACGRAGAPLPAGAPVAATGSAIARPASSGCAGTNAPVAAPRRARVCSSAPSAATTSSSNGRRKPWRASGSPRPSKTSAAPPTSVASAPATAPRPRSERTMRCRRSCAAIERRSSSYCSLTSRVNADSVTAMNGVA
jgi:hypothetical protein